MQRVSLRETAGVILDGSGGGTARVGPLTAREIWYPTNVHVSIENATVATEARCKIYMGSDTTQSNFRDESLFATSGDSSGTLSADVVKAGHYVWAVWSGGQAGKRAVLTVTGLKDV